MGRWFGYRDGYDDVCRLFLPRDAIGWYAHITEAAEELREELKRMEAAGLTPKDFGLKVRAHPDTLIVTARNKMRKAETVYWQVELANRLIETTKVFAEPKVNELNIGRIRNLVSELTKKKGEPTKYLGSFLWQDVDRADVCVFLGAFQNHPASLNTHTEAVVKYCEDKANIELEKWDVAVMGVGGKDTPPQNFETLGPLEVVCQIRRVGLLSEMSPKALSISDTKSRVASRGAEKFGLTDALIDQGEKTFLSEGGSGNNIPDRAYRAVRERPLLMLHVLKARDMELRLGAYGISFPRTRGDRKVALTRYEVNPVWWNEQFQFEFEEEQGNGGRESEPVA
jgi:hypothetical protein